MDDSQKIVVGLLIYFTIGIILGRRFGFIAGAEDDPTVFDKNWAFKTLAVSFFMWPVLLGILAIAWLEDHEYRLYSEPRWHRKKRLAAEAEQRAKQAAQRALEEQQKLDDELEFNRLRLKYLKMSPALQHKQQVRARVNATARRNSHGWKGKEETLAEEYRKLGMIYGEDK
jgi:hypothetical protein